MQLSRRTSERLAWDNSSSRMRIEQGKSGTGVDRTSPMQIRKTRSNSRKHLHLHAAAAKDLRKTKSDLASKKAPATCSTRSESDTSNLSEIEPKTLVDVVDKDEKDGQQAEEEIQEVNIAEEDDPGHKEVVNDQEENTLSSASMMTTNETLPVIKKRLPPPIVTDQEFKEPNELRELHICKLQSIVDLVMWKDVPKSAFVFGFGSFIFLSSSLTRDHNFSMISAVSYMGLLYLAATFFYKSVWFSTRGNIQDSNEMYSESVREEDAVWLLHSILPYLNGFLFNFKTLFSGDPLTTLKLAVILFVSARCGNSFTPWNMARLGFLCVFTVPKICSRYSVQLIAHGNFWIRRFGDVWNSCSHKKTVTAIIFTLVWNLSSTTARIWAVFVLVAAVRYYQQSLCYLREEWSEDEHIKAREQEGDDHTLKDKRP